MSTTMDETLKAWSIERIEKMMEEDPQLKTDLLCMLRFEPDQAREFSEYFLNVWDMKCAIETNTVIDRNPESDHVVLVEALRLHFAEEISHVTR